MIDVSENDNKVVVGVSKATSTALVRSALLASGIPPNALDVINVELPPQDQSYPSGHLQLRYRPFVAGLQYGKAPANVPCTAAFVGEYGTTNRATFLTAAHCMMPRNGSNANQLLNADTFYTAYQNIYATPIVNRAGSEYAEGSTFTGNSYYGNCPSGRVCRYTDVTVVAIDDSVPWVKRVAWPDSYKGFAFTSTLSVAGDYDGFIGDVVTKIGRSQGRVRGVVNNTCVNWGPYSDGITILCSYSAWDSNGDIIEQGGDSGAPVLIGDYLPNQTTGVAAAGVNWGGGGESGSNTFWYSAFSSIQYEHNQRFKYY